MYAGDTNFATSTTSPLIQTVVQGAAVSAVSSTHNPSTYGESVTLSVTVSGGGVTPTGNVAFKDGGIALATVALSGGNASYATATLTVGSHLVTAVYAGDVNYTGTTSAVLTQTVSAPGYTLDGWGGVHPFGGAPSVVVTGYWPGWDIVRGLV